MPNCKIIMIYTCATTNLQSLSVTLILFDDLGNVKNKSLPKSLQTLSG